MKGMPSRYEIRVQGHLAPRRLCPFAGLKARHTPGGETVIAAPCPDQAALYGVLNWLYHLGVPLLSVTPLADDSGARHRRRAFNDAAQD
jgi:hypothetical protein